MVITPEQFEALLDWLDTDRDGAGRKYETIRSGLVRIFVSKGLNDAEDLADEAINRVIARLPDIKDNYVGEPARYFHGVARHIILETYRRKELTMEATAIAEFIDPIISVERECLNACLQILPPEKRDLILDYYLYEGHDKVEHHKLMAKRLKISEGALRGRVHQIRSALQQCVKQRVNHLQNKTVHKGH